MLNAARDRPPPSWRGMLCKRAIDWRKGTIVPHFRLYTIIYIPDMHRLSKLALMMFKGPVETFSLGAVQSVMIVQSNNVAIHRSS
jgi:hypothetical protein